MGGRAGSIVLEPPREFDAHPSLRIEEWERQAELSEYRVLAPP